MSPAGLTRRRVLAAVALVALLSLTVATLFASGAEGRAEVVAGLAFAKAALIGAVFLELDRAWPVWAVTGVLLVGGILVGAVAVLP